VSVREGELVLREMTWRDIPALAALEPWSLRAPRGTTTAEVVSRWP